MIAIEITAAIDAAGTLQTFYVSDASYCSLPTDTPASTFFDPHIVDPGSLGRHAFADGTTGGATRLETGEITLANVDGALDSWLNYSFDGRPVIIRTGTPGAYPASMSTLLVATAEGVEASDNLFIIRLRDAQWRLDKPVSSALYAGSNSPPNGLEGTSNDLKGRRKPRGFGVCNNVTPRCVNTSKLIYQVSDGAVSAIPAVYDRALALTPGADYATGALLQAATPAAGTYITCLAEGYFRLGTKPIGQVTADFIEGVAPANRTVAQILKTLALAAGLTSGEISSSDVSALDATNSSVVGIWVEGETTVAQAMDEVAASIGAWFGFDSAGVLRMGQLAAPSGTPTATVYDYNISEITRRPARDIGTPAWRVALAHSKNYTQQSSDLAGAVTSDRAAWLAEGVRYEIAEDAAIKSQWLLAREVGLASLLTSSSDAATEVARRLALYKVRRDVIDVTVPMTFVTENNLEMMHVVRVVYTRFGCGAGRDFRVIGITLSLEKSAASLTLWG